MTDGDSRGGITLGTLIWCPDGSHKPVQILKNGDEVFTIHETWHSYEIGKVANLKVIKAKDFVILRIGDRCVGCDATQEFLTGAGWIAAKDVDYNNPLHHIVSTHDDIFGGLSDPSYRVVTEKQTRTRVNGNEERAETISSQRVAFSFGPDSDYREHLIVFDVIGGHPNIIADHFVTRMFTKI